MSTTTALPAAAVAILDRITDRTPDDLVEIKEYLGLASDTLLDSKETYEQRCAMAWDWVDKATVLLDLLAVRLGYTPPE